MYRVFFGIQKKHWWFSTKRRIILSLIDHHCKLTKESTILDIGCGSGLMLDDLKQRGQLSGMDMSEEAISFSKELYDGPIKKGALPDDIPYPTDYFDLITALDVIEHVDDDVGSLKSMKRHLRPGGTAIITVPAYMFMWTHFDELNEHKRRYTRGELKLKLLNAGFVIERISYYNTFLFPFIVLIRFFNNAIGRDGQTDVDMPSKLINSILKAIFGFERYFLPHLAFPFGVSVLAIVKNLE